MIVKINDILKATGLSTNLVFNDIVEIEDFELAGPVLINLKLTNAGSRILVQGMSVFDIFLPCSRCGEIFNYVAHIGISEEFLPSNSLEIDDINEVFVYKDDEIDLEEMIRQNIVSSLPMQPICMEECRGLCPQCGENLNLSCCRCNRDEIDPRWAHLANLKFAAQ